MMFHIVLIGDHSDVFNNNPLSSATTTNSSSSIELIGVGTALGGGKIAQKWSWIDEVARIDEVREIQSYRTL